MRTEIADAVGAKVHYRADGRYDYGELYSAVNGRYGELLHTAKKAAASWGRTDEAEQIEALRTARLDACVEQVRALGDQPPGVRVGRVVRRVLYAGIGRLGGGMSCVTPVPLVGYGDSSARSVANTPWR